MRLDHSYREDEPSEAPSFFQFLFCHCSMPFDRNDRRPEELAPESNTWSMSDIFQKLFVEKVEKSNELETEGSSKTASENKDIESLSYNDTHPFVSPPKEIIVGTTEIILTYKGKERIGKVVSFQNPYYTIEFERGRTIQMPLVDVLQCVNPVKNIIIGETEIIQTCDGIDKKGKVAAFNSPYYTIVFEDGSAKQMIVSDVLQLIAHSKEKEVLSDEAYDNMLKKFKELLAKPFLVHMVCEEKKKLKKHKIWVEEMTLFWSKYSTNKVGVEWKKNVSSRVDFTEIGTVEAGINTTTFKLIEKGLKEGENLPEECCFSLTFLNSPRTLDFQVNNKLEQDAFIAGFNLMLREAQPSKSRSSSMW